MKEIIREQEVKSLIITETLILIISAAPLFIWLEPYAFIPKCTKGYRQCRCYGGDSTHIPLLRGVFLY